MGGSRAGTSNVRAIGSDSAFPSSRPSLQGSLWGPLGRGPPRKVSEQTKNIREHVAARRARSGNHRSARMIASSSSSGKCRIVAVVDSSMAANRGKGGHRRSRARSWVFGQQITFRRTNDSLGRPANKTRATLCTRLDALCAFGSVNQRVVVWMLGNDSSLILGAPPLFSLIGLVPRTRFVWSVARTRFIPASSPRPSGWGGRIKKGIATGRTRTGAFSLVGETCRPHTPPMQRSGKVPTLCATAIVWISRERGANQSAKVANTIGVDAIHSKGYKQATKLL